MQLANFVSASNESRSQPEAYPHVIEIPQHNMRIDQHQDMAVQYREVIQDKEFALNMGSEHVDQHLGKVLQPPQAPQNITGTGIIGAENLVASLESYSTSDRGIKKTPFLQMYWKEAPEAEYAVLPSDPAEQKEAILSVFKRYTRPAYIIHGRKVDMEIVYQWIPESLWVANFTEQETQDLVKKEEARIQGSLEAKMTILRYELKAVKAYPHLPEDVPELSKAATVEGRQGRAAFFKLTLDRHTEQTYKWIEFALEIFEKDVPIKEIIRTTDPECATRNQLIAIMVAWLTIHHEGLLKSVYLKHNKAHEDECAAVLDAGFYMTVHPGSLPRDGELLESIGVYFYG
jgi:hypothetical protein